MIAEGSGSDENTTQHPATYGGHQQTFAPAIYNNKENTGAPGQNPHPLAAKKGQIPNNVDQELLIEKDQTIQQLKETIEILELKVKKLEQLVKLKDAKIQNLTQKMQTAGILQ